MIIGLEKIVGAPVVADEGDVLTLSPKAGRRSWLWRSKLRGRALLYRWQEGAPPAAELLAQAAKLGALALLADVDPDGEWAAGAGPRSLPLICIGAETADQLADSLQQRSRQGVRIGCVGALAVGEAVHDVDARWSWVEKLEGSLQGRLCLQYRRCSWTLPEYGEDADTNGTPWLCCAVADPRLLTSVSFSIGCEPEDLLEFRVLGKFGRGCQPFSAAVTWHPAAAEEQEKLPGDEEVQLAAAAALQAGRSMPKLRLSHTFCRDDGTEATASEYHTPSEKPPDDAEGDADSLEEEEEPPPDPADSRSHARVWRDDSGLDLTTGASRDLTSGRPAPGLRPAPEAARASKPTRLPSLQLQDAGGTLAFPPAVGTHCPPYAAAVSRVATPAARYGPSMNQPPASCGMAQWTALIPAERAARQERYNDLDWLG